MSATRRSLAVAARVERALRGRVVEQVRRRGKWIVLDLVGERALVFHLGMTGQLTVADTTEPLATTRI